MKNTSKKIIVSVLTLVLTIIALGTTTFAWFSLSTVSKVSNITGTVTAGDGLEIRMVLYGDDDGSGQLEVLAATPWKANLSEEDVSTFINSIYGGKTLSAVTTPNGRAFTSMGQANLNGNQVIQLGVGALANEDFIEFEVEFRSQAEGKVLLTEVIFNYEGKDVWMDIDGASYLQTPTVTDRNRVVTNAAYGARILFDWNEDVSEVVAFQYSDNTNNIRINGDGYVDGNTTMGQTPVENGQWSFLTVSKGLEIYNADDEVIEETDFPSITLVRAYGNSSVKTGEDEADPYRVEVTLEENLSGAGTMNAFKGSTVVRIWIEGWDADTYDSIYNSVLDISLTFEKDDE